MTEQNDNLVWMRIVTANQHHSGGYLGVILMECGKLRVESTLRFIAQNRTRRQHQKTTPLMFAKTTPPLCNLVQ